MATKITVALEDDLDGGPASETDRPRNPVPRRAGRLPPRPSARSPGDHTRRSAGQLQSAGPKYPRAAGRTRGQTPADSTSSPQGLAGASLALAACRFGIMPIRSAGATMAE
jgi:hypothetical protein